MPWYTALLFLAAVFVCVAFGVLLIIALVRIGLDDN